MPMVTSRLQPPQPTHFVEVGRLCAAWAYFEMITDQLTWRILGVSPKIGSIITRGANAGKLYPISEEAVKIVRRNIYALMDKARDFGNRHDYFSPPPEDVPIVLDWPKPLVLSP